MYCNPKEMDCIKMELSQMPGRDGPGIYYAYLDANTPTAHYKSSLT